MNVNEFNESKYLKAADLKGAQVRVTIERIEVILLGQGPQAQRKPVLYFHGKEKGFVANKTNRTTIAAMYGDEMDDWVGQEIMLYEAMVEFQGKSSPAIRVKAPPRKPTMIRPAVAPSRQPMTEEDIDDEIPF